MIKPLIGWVVCKKELKKSKEIPTFCFYKHQAEKMRVVLMQCTRKEYFVRKAELRVIEET